MAVTRRLTKDLAELKTNPIKERLLIETKDSNILQWNMYVRFRSKPYDDYLFLITAVFPSEYPFKPPKMAFVTKIYHPNVDENGQFCLSSIIPQNWKPATKTERIINDLFDLIDGTDLENPVRTDVAQEYVTNKDAFLKKATEQCVLFAKPYISP
ncbi:hypothetical protein MXB_3286 [Myxobolus squamalis]|nr:hypothetical protein MXB_3286 [Myxobolus squamalis]